MTNIEGDAETHAPTAQQKNLLRLVYIMGLVLVLLFLGLIGGVIWKSTRAKPVATAQSLAMDLGLSASGIRQTEMDGNFLAITTTTELVVIDLVKRKVLLREPLAP
jgi:hypothetical protein